MKIQIPVARAGLAAGPPEDAWIEIAKKHGWDYTSEEEIFSASGRSIGRDQEELVESIVVEITDIVGSIGIIGIMGILCCPA